MNNAQQLLEHSAFHYSLKKYAGSNLWGTVRSVPYPRSWSATVCTPSFVGAVDTRLANPKLQTMQTGTAELWCIIVGQAAKEKNVDC
jgi:hypothetical protein